MGHTMKLGSLILGAILTPLMALPALAQDRAADACWGAVTREAQGQLSARNVTQTSLIVDQRTEVEDLVTGMGRADGRPFGFRCSYNHRNGAAFGVSLSRDGGGGPNYGAAPNYGNTRPLDNRPSFDNRPGPPPQRDPRELAGETCYDPVLAYAQRQHPTASNFKIFLSQNRYGQQSNQEIRVSGQGELRQMNRQRETFSYNCTYNARSGRVSDISMGR
jgi:hypothetical protein